MEDRFVKHVRRASEAEQMDAGWRPIDHEQDAFEANDAEWPDDLTTLYWGRPTYWRLARWKPRCWSATRSHVEPQLHHVPARTNLTT